MTDNFLIKILQDALLTILFISSPILGTSLVVGLLISIIQTVTSIQEQTLTFVPKIIAIFFIIIILSGWIFGSMRNYTINLYSYLSQI